MLKITLLVFFTFVSITKAQQPPEVSINENGIQIDIAYFELANQVGEKKAYKVKLISPAELKQPSFHIDWSSLQEIPLQKPHNSGLVQNAEPITVGHWYRPGLDTTWQWQLQGAVNSGYAVGMYDIDLFDVSAETIAQLHSSGKKVICYFSAGSFEEWRSDAEQFTNNDLGTPLDGWPGERWLDIRSNRVFAIMQARLELALQKGCDGVEPDNMTAYTNTSGFALTAADQLAFNRSLANAAHTRGLSIGLKNDLGQINELVDYFDFAVNEECFEFAECANLEPFTNQGKPFSMQNIATLTSIMERLKTPSANRQITDNFRL